MISETVFCIISVYILHIIWKLHYESILVDFLI